RMSACRTVICLLRNDLRLHDNEVFHWAQRNADHIIPLYCFDPRHYQGTYHFNFPKTGPFRLRFLLDSVKDLRATLKKRGSTLLVREGKTEDVVSDLIQQLGSVTAVAFHEEVASEEKSVEKKLKDICCKNKVKVQTFWGSTLYHRDDLPFSHIRGLPDIYTQFRKVVEGQGRVRPVLSTPEQVKALPLGLEEGTIPTFEGLGQTGLPLGLPMGGETEALARLKHYFWDTKETRNGMIGVDYSTKFSPWLALGCISCFIFSITTFFFTRVIFELLWRDYFKFVGIKYGNRVFHMNGLQDKHVSWKTDMTLFNAWKEGRTGVPFVDANMRELALTGFMSNRGRQNVASFLTKDLGLDWRLGAEWFEYLLVDHDVCSNYGNWLYSAGIGNDPRENRKFNMIKQGLDYDNNGDYVRQWVPELQGIKGGDIHTPWTLSNSALSRAQVSLNETYPSPVITAPEWSRHINNKSSGPPAKGRKGSSYAPRQHKDRGIDFYFSKNKSF
uniref:Cryptochrome DASH n=1 Tax=Sinocyclocheilus rhinocerous TaxID=307959 RepID=A0A673MAT7_9TELE